jgi:hypothetical protein
MNTTTKSLSGLGIVALTALLVGSSARPARAAGEPTTAAEAQAQAQHYSDLAARYRALGGGPAYKTGVVQRAEADAAEYAASAEQLAAPPAAAPVRSPEAEHYAELAARYRKVGGTAYKSGYVQWVEAQECEPEKVPPTSATGTYDPAGVAGPPCLATKPPVRTVDCSK